MRALSVKSLNLSNSEWVVVSFFKSVSLLKYLELWQSNVSLTAYFAVNLISGINQQFD